MLHDPLFFFEQTDFSLRFARCAIGETSLEIEELKEVTGSDAAVLAQSVPAGTQVVCALRPKPRQLHLATADEVRQYPGLAGVQQFVQSPAFAKAEPAWFASVQRSDGSPPANMGWLVSMSPETAQQQARAIFESIKLKPARCLDGTLATIGAITSAVTGTALLIEFGELSSQAILVGPNGVLATRSVTLNLDQIAEAVQTELGLKFRGSAAKLFFNPDCDFTETGAKIAARLAVNLKMDLVPLLAGHPAPVTLCCAGLPGLQHWLEVQLAAALSLAPFAQDIKAWGSAVGVTFSSSALTSSMSPGWFNFLHFINSQTLESPGAVAWQAEWLSAKVPIVAKPAVSAPIVAKTAATPPSVKTAPVTAQTKLAPAPVSPAKTAPVLAAKPAPAAAAKPTPAPSTKPTPVAPAKPAPAKAATASVQYSAKPAVSASSSGSNKSERKNRMPVLVSVGVLALALLGGGYFYFQSQHEEETRIVLEKQKAEQRIKEEEEKARLAEQKASEETERRKKYEAEVNRKLTLAETARKQAEEEARAQAATRLANARGNLVVTTEPAGATVIVGQLPPKTSPATFNYLKLGKYPVTIALAHHEEVKLELEVTENHTTDSGVISLASTVGSVSLASEPSGSNFELHPANTFSLSADAKRTGQTPATLNDLDPGDYTVTYSRPGWAPHTETITVGRNAIAQSAWTFPSGTVKINSSPSGATVSQNDAILGTTPLTLRQPPGEIRYLLTLASHDTVPVSGVLPEGKTLELNAQLPLADLIFGPGELDRNPEPINPKTPNLPSSLTLIEGKVVIQMTINRDGTTADIKLVRASNAEIGRIYMAAVAKWKFKPGMKDGKPVRSAVVVPFLISPS